MREKRIILAILISIITIVCSVKAYASATSVELRDGYNVVGHLEVEWNFLFEDVGVALTSSSTDVTEYYASLLVYRKNQVVASDRMLSITKASAVCRAHADEFRSTHSVKVNGVPKVSTHIVVEK